MRRTSDKEKITLKKRALSALNKALSDVRSGKSELRGKRAEKMAEEMETAMEKAKRVEEQKDKNKDDDVSEETEKKNQVGAGYAEKYNLGCTFTPEPTYLRSINYGLFLKNKKTYKYKKIHSPCRLVIFCSRQFFFQLGFGIPACLRVDDDPHPFFPSARNCFEVVHAVGRGRHVLATRDIPAGTPLLLEEPVAAAMDRREFGSHCHHCFRLIQVLETNMKKYSFKCILHWKNLRGSFRCCCRSRCWSSCCRY